MLRSACRSMDVAMLQQAYSRLDKRSGHAIAGASSRPHSRAMLLGKAKAHFAHFGC